MFPTTWKPPAYRQQGWRFASDGFHFGALLRTFFALNSHHTICGAAMIRRQTVAIIALAGSAAAALTAFAAQPARALTIENYSGASGTGSGWVDLNYTDPDKKPARDGDKRKLEDSGPRFKFGPSEGAARRFDPNSYFTPNYLMGK